MRFKEIFRRRKEPDEKIIRGELILRAEQLILELPMRDRFTSEISVKGKLVSPDLLKLLSLKRAEDLTVGFREKGDLLVYLKTKDVNASICVLGSKISVLSNCPALMDGRDPDHCWELLEGVVKVGEKALRKQKKLDSGTSSS